MADVLRMQFGKEFVDPSNPMSLAAGALPKIPTRGRSAGWKRLPPVPLHLLTETGSFLASIATLKDEINVHYALATLIDFGEPTLLAMDSMRHLPELSGARRFLKKAIEPLPSGPPTLDPPRSERERMLQETLIDDLTAGYPYQPGYRFGRHLLTDLWINAQYLPVLRAATRGDHPFLRRNAVYTLASLAYARDLDAWDILRDVVRRRPDEVSWFRAVRILADADAPGTARLLSERLPGREATAAAFLLRQLGTISKGAPLAPLVETSVEFDSDPDVQWAFLETVGRMSTADDNLRRRVAELAKRYDSRARRSRDRDTKALILRDLAWLALDRFDGGSRILARADRQLGGKAKSRLETFNLSIRGRIAEYLAAKGWKKLADVARDPVEPEPIRMLCIFKGDWKSGDADWLIKIARNRKEPYPVRAAAADRLLQVRPAAGLEEATILVDSYAEGYAGEPTPEVEHAVAGLIASLGKTLSADLLIRTIETAIEVRRQNGMKKQSEFVESLVALLVARGGKEPWPVLERILTGKESVYRGNAAFALSHREGTPASQRLAELLADRDPFVRRCAAFGLEKNRSVGIPWGRITESEGIAEVRRQLDLDR